MLHSHPALSWALVTAVSVAAARLARQAGRDPADAVLLCLTVAAAMAHAQGWAHGPCAPWWGPAPAALLALGGNALGTFLLAAAARAPTPGRALALRAAVPLALLPAFLALPLWCRG